ncbi:glycosyltransferase family 2 protein [Segatella oris]|uniref:Glycosyl transferase, group 2 family n=1 Tax=Segatella oris C735 TaxID=563008 RepID=D7N9N7_9BACT|nr:glycosyltransferase family 2 protein [Segatella oris]EFI49644.1 glycosyl transferase, group 2 family [Segatella oris C735]
MQSKITIITVCYNAQTYIERTILSVINQSYSNIEYLVIDGNSIDCTLQIVRKYEDKITKIISEPDKGIYDAMNKGLQMATGDWVNFMNAGDSFYSKDILAKVFCQDYPDKSVIWGDTMLIRNGIKQGIFKTTPFYNYKLPFRTGKGICHQSMFFRINKEKPLQYDLSFPISADFKLCYDIYKQGGSFLYIPFVISVFDTTGYSSSNRYKSLVETGRILQCENNILFKLYMFIQKQRLQ